METTRYDIFYWWSIQGTKKRILYPKFAPFLASLADASHFHCRLEIAVLQGGPSIKEENSKINNKGETSFKIKARLMQISFLE